MHPGLLWTCNWQHVHRYDLDCYMSKSDPRIAWHHNTQMRYAKMSHHFHATYVTCCFCFLLFFSWWPITCTWNSKCRFQGSAQGISKRFPGSFVHFSCRFKHNNVKTSLTSLARNKTQRITYVASWRTAFVCHDVLKFGNHSTTCSNLDCNSARIVTHMLTVRIKQTSTYTLFESCFRFCSRDGGWETLYYHEPKHAI